MPQAFFLIYPSLLLYSEFNNKTMEVSNNQLLTGSIYQQVKVQIQSQQFSMREKNKHKIREKKITIELHKDIPSSLSLNIVRD